MWKTLGHFFKTVGHLFVGAERNVRAAQPVLDEIAVALGGKAVGFLTLEHLIISIVGDVIDLVRASSGKGTGAVVPLTGEVIQQVEQLIQILEAHPEAPRA